MAEQALAERDKEFWTTRVRALSALAASDALAVVLPLPDGRYVSFAGHNIGHDPAWLDGAAQYLVWSAVKQRTVQRRAETQIGLSDGRTANSIVVAPIPWSERIIGALVALRASPIYEPTIGAPIGDLAQLVGLELAVSSILQRSTTAQRPDDEELRRALDDRRHAIALYEVSRLALQTGGPAHTASVVADALGYGVVGVWTEDDGWLRLDDGFGYGEEPAPVRIDADATLLRVVRDGTTQRVQRGMNGGQAWLGPATEAVVAPLAAGGTTRGVLVLGQPARPFTAADLAVAPTLAECIALARTQRALPAPTAPLELAAPERRTVVEMAPPVPAVSARPGAATMAVETPTPAPSASRSRRSWVLPLFAVALVAVAIGGVLGEPLVFVLAGLLLLVAMWGWLA